MINASNVGLETFATLDQLDLPVTGVGSESYQAESLPMDELRGPNGGDSATKIDRLARPFEAEFEYLSSKIDIKPAAIVRTICKIPGLRWLGMYISRSHTLFHCLVSLSLSVSISVILI